ncbi:MAG TPA: glucose-1-phosphate adenylyltransferase subunit GlgD [Eubacteriaceae bacterium]|jgi:glucose-1-phosphate adenylyltransferase|nr:glucose-1-phosphate adenylyltransferase subunit GlgD [Eubacteriaceae bacterium]
MERCLGIINYSNIDKNFGVLCKPRSSYMLPFGGRYRIVDFALSNMVNHNIRTVALYTGKKFRSAMDHIGNGKPWELNRRINGLFIFPPQFDDEIGALEDIYQYHKTEDFFLRAKEDNIYIINPNIIGKYDLNTAFKYFKDSEADITLIYKNTPCTTGINIGCLNLNFDSKGNFKNIGLYLGTNREFNMFLETGFIKKEVFLDLVRRTMETGEDLDLRQAILRFKNLYKINVCEYKGHVENIRNLKSYYDANMRLLDDEIFNKLFFEGGPIYTKSKDEPPTLYGNMSKVDNSLIANGCIIEGKVENSIIFRGVKIAKHAVVKNSIIMQKSEIGEDSVLVDTILDKEVIIKEGVNLIGSKSSPYVVEKHAIEVREWN